MNQGAGQGKDGWILVKQEAISIFLPLLGMKPVDSTHLQGTTFKNQTGWLKAKFKNQKTGKTTEQIQPQNCSNAPTPDGWGYVGTQRHNDDLPLTAKCCQMCFKYLIYWKYIANYLLYVVSRNRSFFFLSCLYYRSQQIQIHLFCFVRNWCIGYTL